MALLGVLGPPELRRSSEGDAEASRGGVCSSPCCCCCCCGALASWGGTATAAVIAPPSASIRAALAAACFARLFLLCLAPALPCWPLLRGVTAGDAAGEAEGVLSAGAMPEGISMASAPGAAASALLTVTSPAPASFKAAAAETASKAAAVGPRSLISSLAPCSSCSTCSERTGWQGDMECYHKGLHGGHLLLFPTPCSWQHLAMCIQLISRSHMQPVSHWEHTALTWTSTAS